MKEDVVVDSVKGSCEIQEDEEGWGVGVCCHQEIIGHPEQSRFSAVARAVSRLKFLKQIVLFKVVLKLNCNCLFQCLGYEWEV